MSPPCCSCCCSATYPNCAVKQTRTVNYQVHSSHMAQQQYVRTKRGSRSDHIHAWLQHHITAICYLCYTLNHSHSHLQSLMNHPYCSCCCCCFCCVLWGFVYTWYTPGLTARPWNASRTAPDIAPRPSPRTASLAAPCTSCRISYCTSCTACRIIRTACRVSVLYFVMSSFSRGVLAGELQRK